MYSKLVFQKMFGRAGKNSKSENNKNNLFLMGPHEEIYFQHKREDVPRFAALPFEEWNLRNEEGLLLKAYFLKKEGASKTAIMIHGYHSNGIRGNAKVGDMYAKENYNLLLPDNRGCGKSEGKWTTLGLKEGEDTVLWIQELNRRYPDQKIVLHGTSMGGATVCNMAGMTLPSNVKAIVSDCAFASLSEQADHMFRTLKLPLAGYLKKPVEKQLKKNCGYDFSYAIPLENVKKAVLPMLFIHGKKDRYVPFDNFEKLTGACLAPHTDCAFEEAGHATCCLLYEEEYEKVLREFLQKTVG